MPSYDALKNKQTELIRKALDGSAFIADVAADPIETITEVTGTDPDVVVDLAPLPENWDDLGWLSGDGMAFAREVETSDVTSFGSLSPTRSDVTSDSSTLTVVCHETKLKTIGLATGADMANVTPAYGGEVGISKPARPKGRHYRVLSLAVDLADAGEIYIGRLFPRGKVTSYAEQSFASGDEPIGWGVTFTAYEDSDLGYSERWMFGGAGWRALLTDMGFPAEAAAPTG